MKAKPWEIWKVSSISDLAVYPQQLAHSRGFLGSTLPTHAPGTVVGRGGIAMNKTASLRSHGADILVGETTIIDKQANMQHSAVV